jgi:CMP-N,N'-diacetyllegionaminic acid synthase
LNILITICARGGSKGVKNKNIRELAGKPLIAHTIAVAKKWGKAKRIVCSTDSERIAEIAKNHGADVPFIRPISLATDTSGKIPVIRHCTKFCEDIFNEKYDLIVDLDVTNPIRTIMDLDNCLTIFNDKNPDVLLSVVESRKNPYFNMLELNKNGFANICKKPDTHILRRQDTPSIYDANASIYFYNPKFLFNENNNSVFSTEKIAIYVMDNISAFDIDSELDFKIIEFLINERVIKI